MAMPTCHAMPCGAACTWHAQTEVLLHSTELGSAAVCEALQLLMCMVEPCCACTDRCCACTDRCGMRAPPPNA